MYRVLFVKRLQTRYGSPRLKSMSRKIIIHIKKPEMYFIFCYLLITPTHYYIFGIIFISRYLYIFIFTMIHEQLTSNSFVHTFTHIK